MFWVSYSLCGLVRRELALGATLLFCAAAVLTAPAYAQTYTVLHNFTGGADGYYPNAGLTLNGTSNLFGGAGDNAIFHLRQSGTGWIFSPIYDFNGTDGDFLSGRLTFGPDGALYGASGAGGIPDCGDGAGCGLIFSLRPTRTICRTDSCPWSQTVLYQFNPLNLPNDGYGPTGGLVFDSAGNIYGTTAQGGRYSGGSAFMLAPSRGRWNETNLYDFRQGANGTAPNGNLVVDRSGNVIGTTSYGGANDCFGVGCGIVFELTHNSGGWTETILHTFTDGADGARPFGGLISDAAGNLYGTATMGGVNGGGTVYELTPSNGGYGFQVLYSFSGNNQGGGPGGILAFDSVGNLYGSTGVGGIFHQGTIFKLTPGGGSWTLTDLHDFTGGLGGSAPSDGPVLDPSGNLYGTATFGGTGGNCPGGCGVVWQITP